MRLCRWRPSLQANKHYAQYDARSGDLARTQPIRQNNRRNRFHRLHGYRQSVEQSGRDQRCGKAEQHAGRRKPGDHHRSDRVRDEGPEIAARAAEFLQDTEAAVIGHGARGRQPLCRR